MIANKTNRLLTLIWILSIMAIGSSAMAKSNNLNESLKYIYDGAASLELNLEKDIQETRYKTVDKESTCSREIPYTQNVCKDEVFYRTQCHTVPARRDCRTEYENICHYETKYRRSCHTEPGQRICSTKPGRRVCRNVPGARRCRTNRRGQEVCKTTPSRQVCRTAPGREVCRRETGRRVCRQEPYQDYVCRSVPRNRCYNVPAEEVCNQIPYTENICRDVTKYRTETYACTKPVQVPYQVTRKLQTNINVNFENLDQIDSPNIKMVFKLLANSQIKVLIKDQSSQKAFIFETQNLNKLEEDLSTTINGEINLRIEKQAKYLDVFQNDFYEFELRRKSLEFKIFEPKDTRGLLFELIVERKSKEKFSGVLTQESIKWHEYEGTTHAVVDFNELGFKVRKNKEYKLIVKMSLKDLGNNLLNPIQEQITKTQEVYIKASK